MLNQEIIRKNRARYALAGMMILLMLAVAPLAAATGIENVGTYSGDDAYDPAAGGSPEASVSAAPERFARAAASLSGDDAYDPAAVGTAGLLLASASGNAAFSGDDYDPAVANNAEFLAFSDSPSDAIACVSAGPAIAGVYSGDDDYDPAAGANPELALRDLSLAALCTPSTASN